MTQAKIRAVVDDGVRAEDIQQLIGAANGTADVKVALGVAPGTGIDPALDPNSIHDWLTKSWDTEIGPADDRTTVGEQIMSYCADG